MFIPNSLQHTQYSRTFLPTNGRTRTVAMTDAQRAMNYAISQQATSVTSHDRCTFTGHANEQEKQPDFSDMGVRYEIRETLRKEKPEEFKRLNRLIKQMDSKYRGQRDNLVKAFQEWWNTRPGMSVTGKQTTVPEQPIYQGTSLQQEVQSSTTHAEDHRGMPDFSEEKEQINYMITIGGQSQAAERIRDTQQLLRKEGKDHSEARRIAYQHEWLRQDALNAIKLPLARERALQAVDQLSKKSRKKSVEAKFLEEMKIYEKHQKLANAVINHQEPKLLAQRTLTTVKEPTSAHVGAESDRSSMGQFFYPGARTFTFPGAYKRK